MSWPNQKLGLMVIFEIFVRYISVFHYCISFFYLFCTSTLENKSYTILLKRLSCILDISHCDVIYYIIYIICSHNVRKAISPLFAWASSYIKELSDPYEKYLIPIYRCHICALYVTYNFYRGVYSWSV